MLNFIVSLHMFACAQAQSISEQLAAEVTKPSHFTSIWNRSTHNGRRAEVRDEAIRVFKPLLAEAYELVVQRPPRRLTLREGALLALLKPRRRGERSKFLSTLRMFAQFRESTREVALDALEPYTRRLAAVATDRGFAGYISREHRLDAVRTLGYLGTPLALSLLGEIATGPYFSPAVEARTILAERMIRDDKMFARCLKYMVAKNP